MSEADRADTLRVVEASLAPPAWMGPVDAAAEAAAEAHEENAQQMVQLVGDYGKLVEDGDLADGVFVVEGGRFPLHRNVLAARSEWRAGGSAGRRGVAELLLSLRPLVGEGAGDHRSEEEDLRMVQ